LTVKQLAKLRAVLEGLLESQRAVCRDNDVVADSMASADEDDVGWEREMARLTADRAREVVADVEHALARLDRGDFGACELCDRPIPFERLEALPHTRRCAPCSGGGRPLR
jgi:RNA polymerase-binding transcription factor DksA